MTLAAMRLQSCQPGQAPPQPPPPAPPVTKFEELRRGVGMFIGNGGTIGYLVNADGAVAVDSQFMNTAEICVKGLKERAAKGIELLINTHHHGDHTGGNLAFKGAVKRIVCQENCLLWHKKVSEGANNVGCPGVCRHDVRWQLVGDLR